MSESNVSVLATSPQARMLSDLHGLEREVLAGKVSKLVMVFVDAAGQLNVRSPCGPPETNWLLDIAKAAILPRQAAVAPEPNGRSN